MYRQPEVSRVLARSGARLVAQEEWERVAGGIITNNCTIVQGTKCTLDGDCPIPIRCP